MIRLTANNLVKAIKSLPRNVDFDYVATGNSGKIRIISTGESEGPIKIKSYDPKKGKNAESVKTKSISTAMLWGAANALSSRQPVSFDRVFSAGGNTRSVLEALLAHTPEFSICYPKRFEKYGTTSKQKSDLKHIWWQPESLHENGTVKKVDTEKVISELYHPDVVYEALDFGGVKLSDLPDIQRRHAQIQIALIFIGSALQFKTSVAIEDQAIMYEGKRLAELESVVVRLGDLTQVASFPAAIEKIRHVDIVWFKNGTLMPAALEIEHTTGFNRGFDRLKGLQDLLPPYPVRYVIVAEDHDRAKVVELANADRFKSLNVRFFPYSAVEELYSLCTQRTLRGVTEAFLDSFMEPVLLG